MQNSSGGEEKSFLVTWAQVKAVGECVEDAPSRSMKGASLFYSLKSLNGCLPHSRVSILLNK